MNTFNEETQSSFLKEYLKVYRIEPIGYLLNDRLHLPLSAVWLFFLALAFGVLLTLHTIVATPKPSTFSEVFQLPSNVYYYPNLIAIAYDLIGIPLILTFLVLIRHIIPAQFLQLEQDRFIREKKESTRSIRFLRSICLNSNVRFLLVVVLPVSAAIFGLAIDVWLYAPQELPAQYALFLSFLGRYARVAIFIQIAYIFAILNLHNYEFRLHFHHPDKCSGLAPFGNLALISYLYFFVHAVLEAVSIAAGGGAFERALRTMSGSLTLLYLWIIFPISFILVFAALLLKPHRELLKVQRHSLLAGSSSWTDYHHQVAARIVSAFQESKPLPNARPELRIEDDLKSLEMWRKLFGYVEDMHTWPIPKYILGIAAIIVNPLIPLLLPLVVEWFRNLLA